MPRRFACRFAQATTLGCSRMDTGMYLSVPLGGRPRLARGFPSLAAIADRAAFTSSSVTRRARSKGNSLRFFIASPLFPTRAPCADEPVDVAGLSDREDDHQDAVVRLSNQPSPLFPRLRVAGVWRHECEGIVERRDRLLEGDAMLRVVGRSLPRIPLIPHFQYIPKIAPPVEPPRWEPSASGPATCLRSMFRIKGLEFLAERYEMFRKAS